MIKNIYSRINSERLLHVVFDGAAGISERADLSPSDQFLQSSVIPLERGRVVAPHAHQKRKRPYLSHTITQEAWVVISGKIRVSLFDTDHSLLSDVDLTQGCLLVTFYGGHSLECLSEDTVMLEIKNGPYEGRDFDLIETP
jgi:cupin fold WbuC family metalloprotein